MSPARTYLDHAATTPALPEVIDAVAEEMARLGNPSSLHRAGRSARRRVEEQRERLAAAVGARPSEVVFTAGGTEADNLAVKGLFWARRHADPRRTRVLASAVEHHAVLDPVLWLVEAQGAEVEWLPVDSSGRVHPEVVEAAIAGDPAGVALVTVMWANNEVGTIMPIGEISAICHRYDVPLHCDAVQVLGQRPLDFSAAGPDAVALSGHKFGGPMGVGALLVRPDLDLVPVLHGGGQERGVRSGTLDVASIAGFALAAERAAQEQPERSSRMAALRDDLVRRVLDAVRDAHLNGEADPQRRLPGNAHLSFPGCDADALLMLLDAAGVECSTGSACSAGVPEPSHVMLAMGAAEASTSSLRFSLGHCSTPADVDALLEALPSAVDRARAAGRLTLRGA